MGAKILLLLVLVGFVAGCALQPSMARNQTVLTVTTQPAGAMIYEGGRALGVSPQRILYTDTNGTGSFTTNSIKAIWASGATKDATFPVNTSIKEWSGVISRPEDAPNLDKDLNYAAQLQSINAQQMAARAAAVQTILNSQPQPITTRCHTDYLTQERVCTSQ